MTKTPTKDTPYIQLHNGARIHLPDLEGLVERVTEFVEAGERDLEVTWEVRPWSKR